MSDLLQIGKSGVMAYRGALAAVGENVTNSDTDGYARRTVTMREQAADPGPFTINRSSSAFGGVAVADVSRVWDQYRAANAWSSASDDSRAGTRAQYLSTVESQLDDSDTGVGTRLSAVFTSATALSADPSDTSLRQTMLSSIDTAARALGQTGANLAKVADTVRAQATTLTGQTNDQLTQLAQVNLALHTAAQGTAARAQMEDQRDQLVGAISSAIGVDVTLDGDGAAALRLNDYTGPVLLAANSTAPAYLQVQIATDGRLSTSIVAADGTSSAATPTGGMLSGLIDVSATIVGRRQQLDGLAARFATQLNDWQAAGVTAAGVAGVPLLTGTTAATLALATSDPADIAAASPAVGTTPSVENGNLLALTNLRGADGIEAGWRQMTTDQSLAVAAAKAEATAAGTRKDSAYTALDEVSGIDLDVEAAELLRYQQAYSASAKIIQTARDTLQSIFDLF